MRPFFVDMDAHVAIAHAGKPSDPRLKAFLSSLSSERYLAVDEAEQLPQLEIINVSRHVSDAASDLQGRRLRYPQIYIYIHTYIHTHIHIYIYI